MQEATSILTVFLVACSMFSLDRHLLPEMQPLEVLYMYLASACVIMERNRGKGLAVHRRLFHEHTSMHLDGSTDFKFMVTKLFGSI